MNRAVRLRPLDVLWLAGNYADSNPGCALRVEFQGQAAPRSVAWVMRSFANALSAFPNARARHAVVLRATSRGVEYILWAPTTADAQATARHWCTFNPAIRVKPTSTWPEELAVGSWLRAEQLVLKRPATLPIKTEFGRQGTTQLESPVQHLLDSLPDIEPGSCLLVSLVWHLGHYWWRHNPFVHLDPLSGDTDPRALAEKARFFDPYAIHIRLLEIRTGSQAPESLLPLVAEAFSVYDREGSNGFWFRTPPRMRSHTLRLANTILGHRCGPPYVWGRLAPHFTALEAAALLHPLPPGSEADRLPRRLVTEKEAPHDAARLDLNAGSLGHGA